MTVRCLVLILAFGTACKSREAEAPEAPPLHVAVTQVERRDLTLTAEVTGSIEAVPGMDVKLTSLSAGKLATMLVAEGDAVKKGQLLAELERAPLEDALQKAEADASDADAAAKNDAEKLRRAEELFKAGVSARQEVDDAKAQRAASDARNKSALAEVSTARRQLQHTRLEAPFDGLVAHVFSAPGEVVDPSKPVIEVANVEQLELRANLPAAVLSRVQRGQSVRVVSDGAKEPAAGEVFAISPSVDPTTGAGVVRIRIASPGRLHLGQVVRASIALEVHKQVSAVPVSALTRQDGAQGGNAASQRAVTVVGADSRTQTVAVKTGAEEGGYVELEAGPEPGTLVVAGGGYSIPDGTAVEVDGGTEAEK
ncbi:MAG: efflux RND transporter periplasmic adaptor subunit [Myxococcaceae bacterium]